MDIINAVRDYISYYLPLLILIGFAGFLAILSKAGYSDEEKSVSISHRIRKN